MREKKISAGQIVAIVILAIICGAAGWKFFDTYTQYKKADLVTYELIEMKHMPDDTASPDEPLSCYEKYKDIAKLNSDMVGWIEVQDTNINHPVMQSTYEPEFYLYRDFYKNSNNSGTPFAQANCAVGLCGNTIIYGHNMSNGTVFSELSKYTDKGFAKSHPIHFDTLTEYGKYEVVAVFSVDAASTDFPFWEYLCSSEEELMEYITLCKHYSYFDTDVEINPNDKLISLVTCEYTHNQGRLVVVAKEI